MKESKKVLETKNQSLNEDVKKALKQYFKSLDSQEPRDVYDLVMREVETPLFSFILQHTNNNQSKAAKIIGINRGTFRTKLKKYGIIK